MRTHSSLSRVTSLATLFTVAIGAFVMASAPASAESNGVTGARLEIPADATPAAYLLVDASGKVVRDASIRIETKSAKKFAVVKASVSSFCVPPGPLRRRCTRRAIPDRCSTA